MPEKRIAKRYPRRVKVKFGETDLSNSGSTADVSAGGCFIVFAKPPPLDKRLHIQLTTEGEKFVQYEGRVRWQKLVPPELRQIERNGFGVQFLMPEELLLEVIPHIASAQRLTLTFPTEADLSRVYQQEIRAGGLFIKSDKRFARDQEVLVELRLEFTRRQFEFPATVIHVQEAGAEAGVRGVGVTFDDQAKVKSALAPYVK